MNLLRFFSHLLQFASIAVSQAWQGRTYPGVVDVMFVHPLSYSPTDKELRLGRNMLAETISAALVADGAKVAQ